ncbi:hypothetical protein SAMN02745194_04747 [Roseomonas rosea]|uniref:Uncharacterized protein n=1 Tax=Muricoccus roseus TaxID=198092 RepID=A0A1M6RRB7_9PROT|nr:hypothetical protein [Roseomonas rosea]SHK34888.1 hypothetical protein SAMN02745194_04747 [Roseomonas rosea]
MPEATDAGTLTVHDLAALCGLDVRHFERPGPGRDPGFGSHALATTCEVVEVFSPAGPGQGPHARDKGLLDRCRLAYRRETWVPRYRALNDAFLAHEKERWIASPLRDSEMRVLGSMVVAHLQVTACLEGGRLVLLLGIGSAPVGLYYPAESLLLYLTALRLNPLALLRLVLDQLTRRPLAWAAWLHRAMKGELQRVFVVGDNRPGHFMRQTLAYLDAEETKLLAFGRAGGLLVRVPDWCAMDPCAVFPSLASVEGLVIPSPGLTDALLAHGYDAHRVYRFTIYPDSSWLRRRLAPLIDAAGQGVAGRRFRVMISLDAERERVINAVEVFRFVLRKLGEACDADGSALEVVWDGWTVSGAPSARDQEVIGRIEALMAAITAELPVTLAAQHRIFGRSALEKVPVLAACDLAITTQGTGAMVASWLLQRPTIVYHVPGAVSNRDYLDEGTAVDMDPRAVGLPPPGSAEAGNHQRFNLAPWGMEEALRRAVGGRLAIRPEARHPDAPPSTPEKRASPEETLRKRRDQAIRDAAQELAALLGLDMRHFRFPGRETDPAFGSAALTTAYEIVDVLGPMGAGDGPHGADAVLHERIRTHYRHTTWLARYRTLNAAFLAHEGRGGIHSPFSGEEAMVLGSIPLAQYQVTPCLDGERLILLVGIGYMPVGLVYPAENLFLVLTDYRLNMRQVLGSVLAHLLHRPLPWREWLRRAMTSGLRRAYVIGDNRPSHFIRESLAYLNAEEDSLVAFGRKGGLLVQVTDWCAMDPFAVLPALAPLDRLAVRSEAVTETLLLAGYDAHRVYRTIIYPNSDWLRRQLASRIESAAGAGVGRRFRVAISLDAERERLVNAVEVFRFVLRKLGEACTVDGSVLEVVWDGWTVSGEPSARDREVIGRIKAMVAAITRDLPVTLTAQKRVFGRTALAKLPELATCDLVITTQGTGGVVASWLLRRPTIVYHVAGAASNMADLDPATVIPVDQRAVGELPPGDPRAGGHQRFTLAPWGMEEALCRAVGGRLAIRRECEGPEPRA